MLGLDPNWFPTAFSGFLEWICLDGRLFICAIVFVIRTDQIRGIEYLCYKKHTPPAGSVTESIPLAGWMAWSTPPAGSMELPTVTALKNRGTLWRHLKTGNLQVRTQRGQLLTLTCFWNVRRPCLCIAGQKRTCGTHVLEFHECLPSSLTFAVYFRLFYFK